MSPQYYTNPFLLHTQAHTHTHKHTIGLVSVRTRVALQCRAVVGRKSTRNSSLETRCLLVWRDDESGVFIIAAKGLSKMSVALCASAQTDTSAKRCRRLTINQLIRAHFTCESGSLARRLKCDAQSIINNNERTRSRLSP